MSDKEKLTYVIIGYRNDNPEEYVKEKVEINDPEIEIDRSLSWEERKPLYDKQDAEIEKQIKVHVERLNLDKYTYRQWGRYSEYNYEAISYDGPENPDDEVIYMSDEIRDRLREELAQNDGNYMFLDGERIEMPLWRNRDKATTREEAVTYLARAVSECFPYSVNDDRKEVMNAYAEKWGIPLDIDLLERAGGLFNSYDCASWNTSSKFC